MYRRLDQLVDFPRDLALDLDQGTVIATLVLDRDGRVADVRVTASSGYTGFDDAFTGAVRRAASFGPVPAALLGDRGALAVRVPYTFRNPMIR
jgi:TonB family protein